MFYGEIAFGQLLLKIIGKFLKSVSKTLKKKQSLGLVGETLFMFLEVKTFEHKKLIRAIREGDVNHPRRYLLEAYSLSYRIW